MFKGKSQHRLVAFFTEFHGLEETPMRTFHLMFPGSWRSLSLSCMADGHLLCDHLLATDHGSFQILQRRRLRDVDGKPAS